MKEKRNVYSFVCIEKISADSLIMRIIISCHLKSECLNILPLIFSEPIKSASRSADDDDDDVNLL